MTTLTKTLMALVASFTVLGLIVRILPPPNLTPAPTQRPGQEPDSTAGSGALTITIATNDTKAEWLEIVTKAFNAAGKQTASGRQIVVEISQEGEPAPAVERVATEIVTPVLWSPADISWVEQMNQIRKDRGQAPLVKGDCPRVAYVATGFGMWRPMAEALGWPDKPIGWKQIVDLAADPRGWATYGHPEWGQFTFGHSHPEYSSTGFNMLATLAYAALGKTDGLTPEQVKSKAVQDAFRTVELNTYHYGASTRGLMTLMAQRGPSYLHAAATSETSLLKNNEVHKNSMRFPFAFIFPAEGTFWMDNPVCILEGKWVSAEQREAAKVYRDYLLAPESQDRAVTIGLRPAVPGVPLHAPIALEYGTDPRVSPQTVPPLKPVSGETNAAIVDVFKEAKKKSTIVLVLDTSASMVGTKINKAVEGSAYFLGLLHRDDEIVVYSFNDQVTQLQPSGRVGDVVERLGRTITGLFAQGNTALYDAVCKAAEQVNQMKAEDKAAGELRLYGVVVLSDGKDTNSKRTQNDMFGCLPSGEDVEAVKVYTIAYGDDADKDLLKRIATRTNGKSFTGNPQNVQQIYKDISAEQ